MVPSPVARNTAAPVRHNDPVPDRGRHQRLPRRPPRQLLPQALADFHQRLHHLRAHHGPVGFFQIAFHLHPHLPRPFPGIGDFIPQVGEIHNLLHLPEPVRPRRITIAGHGSRRTPASTRDAIPGPGRGIGPTPFTLSLVRFALSFTRSLPFPRGLALARRLAWLTGWSLALTAPLARPGGGLAALSLSR